MAIQYKLSDEQTMLQDSVSRWVLQSDPRQASTACTEMTPLAEMGWLAAGQPEELGGLGGSAVDQAIIAEQLGRGLIRAPYVDVAVIAAHVLSKLDPAGLGELISGERLTLVAHDELDSRGDSSWCSTRAEKTSEGTWRLFGKKTALLGATQSARILCTAKVGPSGFSLFELARPQDSLRTFATFDDRPGAELHLDAAPASPFGALGGAEPIVTQAWDLALVVESAEALGAMQRAFELTRDYVRTRKQYGQAIGDFQAVRHLLADMFIELQQARSIIQRALEVMSEDDSGARRSIAAATKARVAQAGLLVTGQAIQLHGGIGVTEEYPVGHYFKRLVAFNLRHGSADEHVERYVALK